MYGFTIRGQVFQFSTREEYLAAFSNSLNIAQAQLKERKKPDPYRRPLKPPEVLVTDECRCTSCIG